MNEVIFCLPMPFYYALQENHVLPAPTIFVTDSEAWLQRPLTPVDSLLGKLKIDSLTSDYPFTETLVPLTLPVARDKETALAIERFRGKGFSHNFRISSPTISSRIAGRMQQMPLRRRRVAV